MTSLKFVIDEMAVRLLRKPRFMYYRPHWAGWGSLSLVRWGHDEWSRYCFIFGWAPITGCLWVPVRYCGDQKCYRETLSVVWDEIDWIE